METINQPLHSERWSVLEWKIMDTHTSFILIIIFVHEAFEYADGSKFWDYAGTNADHFVYTLLFCEMSSLCKLL
jgi:hypothetical protein